MEIAIGKEIGQQEFAIASVFDASSTSTVSPSLVSARFSIDSGVGELRFCQDSETNEDVHVDLGTTK
ncbi:type I protein arginine methyltransferase, partial [Sarracenia purpurea var. burkii]